MQKKQKDNISRNKIFFFLEPHNCDLVRILINVPKNKCKRNKRITFHVIKILAFLDLVRILIKQKETKG